MNREEYVCILEADNAKLKRQLYQLEQFSAREIAQKIGEIEEAWETIYEVVGTNTVIITYKYSDSTKKIYITWHFTEKFKIEGNFWIESIDLIQKLIHKVKEELGWN